MDEKNREIVCYDLGQTDVPPLSSVRLTSRRASSGLRSLFRPTGFRIPDEVAADFFISDVKVGKNSQFYSVGVVPAEIYAESYPVVEQYMDAVPPGSEIVLEITNTSDRPATFRGQVRGRRAETTEDGRLTYDERVAARDLPVVMGLGYTKVAGGSRANVNVQTQVSVRPCRLCVPPHVLADLDVASLTSERYLEGDSTSCVPVAQLTAENISAGGSAELSPEPCLAAGSYFTVEVVNRSGEDKFFCGALLAHLVR